MHKPETHEASRPNFKSSESARDKGKVQMTSSGNNQMIQTVGPSTSQLVCFLQKVSIRLTGRGKVMMIVFNFPKYWLKNRAIMIAKEKHFTGCILNKTG